MELEQVGVFGQFVRWGNIWYTTVFLSPQASSLAAGVATQFQPPWLWSSGWQTSVRESNSCSRSPRELQAGVPRNWRCCFVNCLCTASVKLWVFIARVTRSALIFLFSSLSRTSTCALVACLCQRLTSPLPASMWPRPTAGLWRSCVWRSMWPLPRVPHWMPAALASKVRSSTSSIVISGCVTSYIVACELRYETCADSILSAPMGVTIIKNIDRRDPGKYLHYSWKCSPVDGVHGHFFSPRSETAGSYLCQQQAFSVHLHLHWAASHSAPLDQAEQRWEETHGMNKIFSFLSNNVDDMTI